MTERIIRKTEELIERPFTTQPKHYVKRGCNTVRSRCTFYVDQLKVLNYTLELPLEKAKELFSEIVGAYDRATLKAYFGTLPGKSTRKIRRWARYQSGTQSVKDIELTQETFKTKGYLEKLGLVTYECHSKVWFMVLENWVLVPQLERVDVGKSKDKISLIPFTPKGKGEGGKPILEVVPSTKETINNNNLQGEREIGRVKVNVSKCKQPDLAYLTFLEQEAKSNEG